MTHEACYKVIEACDKVITLFGTKLLPEPTQTLKLTKDTHISISQVCNGVLLVNIFILEKLCYDKTLRPSDDIYM